MNWQFNESKELLISIVLLLVMSVASTILLVVALLVTPLVLIVELLLSLTRSFRSQNQTT